MCVCVCVFVESGSVERCSLGCCVMVFQMTWEVVCLSCVFAFVVGLVGWLFGCSTHMTLARPPFVVVADLCGIF